MPYGNVGNRPSRKRLVMLTYNVFGDESSDQKCEVVFAVGGIFGDETQWDSLATKWVGITQGEEFHAADKAKKKTKIARGLYGKEKK